jgi:hypothetical protein
VGRELLVAYPPRYRFERSVPPELSWRLSPTQLEQLRAEALEVERNADAARMVHPEEARVLRSCAVRLNTLSNCLEVIEDERLYGAVVEQIDSTLMRLKRILAGRPRWALLQRQLKELRPQHFAARR